MVHMVALPCRSAYHSDPQGPAKSQKKVVTYHFQHLSEGTLEVIDNVSV